MKKDDACSSWYLPSSAATQVRGAAHFTACELHFAADWTRHNHSISYKCWIINRKNTHNLFGSQSKKCWINSPNILMCKYGWPTVTIFTFCNKYQLFIESKNGSQHTVIFVCLKYAASQFMRHLISLFSAAHFMRIVHFGLIWTSGLFISRLFCSYLCTRWPSV